MSSFDTGTLEQATIPLSTGWLLGQCMEAKGKQDLWLRQKPEILESLREQAMIQSAESSNRIEGVTVDADRLRPLVLGRSKPRDRSEEEVAGYRKALDWIFTSQETDPIDKTALLLLHKLAQGDSGDAGRWKERDNEIIEILPTGERKVRFRPAPAAQVPEAVTRL
jgi:Fic family protein